jgi:hypothetical protein
MNIITAEMPEDEPSRPEEERSRGRARGRGDRPSREKIPSVEECLATLSRLSGLVLLNVITPAQANVVRANTTETLRYHLRNESRGSGKSVADADLLDVARSNPRMLALLEPFLTPDQIDLVMGDGAEDDDG